ncbi:hypothetical protein D3C72_359190 [compost metagenome]
MQDASFLFSYYVNAFGNEAGLRKILLQAKKEIDPQIQDIPIAWLHVINTFLNKEPYCLWNREVSEAIFHELEKIYSEIDDIDSLVPAFEYFFGAYFAFQDIANATQELENLYEASGTKTRMFRIPTYATILESCVSQLYKFVIAHIDKVTPGGVPLQTKLGPLCNQIKKCNLSVACEGVDVDLRNSISHGTYFLSNKETLFYFSKGKDRATEHKKLIDYKFDEIIDEAIDTASGMLLGIIRFFVRYPDRYKELIVNLKGVDFVSISTLKLQLTLPKARCLYVESTQYERPQIEIYFDVDFETKADLLALGIVASIVAKDLFPEYLDFFIAFEGKNLLPSNIRFRREEVEEYLAGTISLEELAIKPYERQQVLLWDNHKPPEEVDRYRHFSFKPIECDGWRVRAIEDISTDEKKRFKADLYVGEMINRDEIKKSVQDAMDAIRVLFNPPRESYETKHGEIEADAVYLNVYRKFQRSKFRDLFPKNKNFILVAHYNARNMKPLTNGGLPAGLWSSYYKEKNKQLLFAWNPMVYKELK